MDRFGVASGALAPRAENFSARAQPQYPRGGMRRLAPKLAKHRVEHRAGHLVAMIAIVQSEIQDIACALDHHSSRRMGAREFDRFS
jgi:hypothetical protein